MRLGRCAPTLGALFALSGVASANGRTAATATVSNDPSAPSRIIVGATFGPLISEDDGATWRWSCEENIGYSGVYDPVYVVTPVGTVIATTEGGLRISRDHGCSYGIAPEVEGRGAVDVTVGPDGRVWAAITANSADPSVFVSGDDAATFTSAGLGRLRTVWRTLRVAPSDAERVFVSGYLIPTAGGGAATPLLYRREADGGWTEIPFSASGATEIAVLAVDPVDADVVYAKIAGETADRLFRSDDGGVSWDPVLTLDGFLTGFVPPEGGEPGVVTSKVGSGWRSVDGLTWTPTEAAPHGFNLCLVRRPGGRLMLCGNNTDFERSAIVTSDDDLASIEGMFRFTDIAGPLECPGVAGVHNDVCVPTWPSVRAGLGMIGRDAVTVDAVTTPDAPGTGGGGGGCGCGVALGVGLVGVFGRRRRRS